MVLAMVKFASVVAQVFSGQYVHPDGSQWLQHLAENNALFSGSQGFNRRKRSITNRSSQSSRNNDERFSGEKPSFSKCPMRYGIAKGAVVAGVLPGRCPAFDVWGQTVNLACRMEQTSRAGNVQVTQATYDAIFQDPDCTFLWESPITTYAKGFGNVQTYFVKTDMANPPTELLESLSIRPFLGAYHFNNFQTPTSPFKRQVEPSTPPSPTRRQVQQLQQFQPNAQLLSAPPENRMRKAAAQAKALADEKNSSSSRNCSSDCSSSAELVVQDIVPSPISRPVPPPSDLL